MISSIEYGISWLMLSTKTAHENSISVSSYRVTLINRNLSKFSVLSLRMLLRLRTRIVQGIRLEESLTLEENTEKVLKGIQNTEVKDKDRKNKGCPTVPPTARKPIRSTDNQTESRRCL